MEFTNVFNKGIDTTRPVIIAGPCSAESEEQVINTAKELASNGIQIFRAGIWKPRTKPGGFEGVGIIGLPWLQNVQKTTSMQTAVEVATKDHVEAALAFGVDYLWIGARTVANPFAMQEIADTLKGKDIPVLVKNPVNPDLELWIGGIERLYNAGIRRIAAIHRGFSIPNNSIYRNDPVWNIPIELKRRLPNIQMICDPSHICGRRDLIKSISQIAMDLGFDGLIVESHYQPEVAWTDAKQQLAPNDLKDIISNLVIRDNKDNKTELTLLRNDIDKIDQDIMNALSERFKISEKIAIYKKNNNMAVFQNNRYNQIMEEREKTAKLLNIDSKLVEDIFELIHTASVNKQIEIMN